MHPRSERHAELDADDGAALLACDPANIPLGAHLVSLRRGYLHHGIYVGEGRVVHYAGLCRLWHRGPIEEVSLERFSAGKPTFIKAINNARFQGAAVVERARSRLGENRYRITSNNCEHFCEWCIHGEPRSRQVDRLVGWPPLFALRRATHFVRLLTPERIGDRQHSH
jgi:hypothetical protein